MKGSKKVAVVQSNYIPWKGYFDLIQQADEFILFDDMQYTKRDWRNRNRIKTAQGPAWLTIPVEVTGKFSQKIKETVVADPDWPAAHWKTINRNYAQARHYSDFKDRFEALYLGCIEKNLSQINYRFLKTICDILGIKTKISWSMDYQLIEGKTDRLIDLCKQAGAAEYISGPSAKGYLDEALFAQEGIRLTYMNYSGYPAYTQLFPPFVHEVSILDLIFNEGDSAKQSMLSFKDAPARDSGR